MYNYFGILITGWPASLMLLRPVSFATADCHFVANTEWEFLKTVGDAIRASGAGEESGGKGIEQERVRTETER